MGKFQLVNPKISDSKINLSYDADSAEDAANMAWLELGKKYKLQPVKKGSFGFSLKSSDGKIHSFAVTEERADNLKSNSKDPEKRDYKYKITPINEKPGVEKKLNKMMEGGKKKDDSDSDSSDESDDSDSDGSSDDSSDDSDIYVRPRMKTVELIDAPKFTTAKWEYYPHIYSSNDVKEIWVPRGKVLPQLVLLDLQ